MTKTFRITIETLILSGFFLLPFARFKLTLFGLPLYALEIPVLIAAILYTVALIRKRAALSLPLFTDRYILAGIILFVFGALLSFAANPFSQTGLGLLKSWIFFPIAAAALWSAASHDTDKLFGAWFIAVASIALSSLVYLSLGILTFDGRLEAWYTSPNFLAIILAPGILIGTHLITSLLAEKRTRPTLLIAVSLSLPTIAIALFFTRSYGAWIAVATALTAYLLPAIKMQRTAILAILLAIISIFALSEYGSEKWQSLISQSERSSLASRLMIWRSAEMMAIDHPLTGIGIGRFQEEYLSYQRYFPPYLEWAVPEPHNLFFALLLNTGLIGLIGFSILVGRLIQRTLQTDCATDNKKMSRLLILSLMILFLTYGLLDTPYFGNDLSFLFFILIASGVGFSIDSTDRSDTTDASGDR
jgi:O-antigen ligase